MISLSSPRPLQAITGKGSMLPEGTMIVLPSGIFLMASRDRKRLRTQVMVCNLLLGDKMALMLSTGRATFGFARKISFISDRVFNARICRRLP